MKPGIRRRLDSFWIVRPVVPAPPVEQGQRNSAPMHASRRIEAALHVDAHDHRAALLDFANFTQLDIIAEAGNQRGLQIESGHVAAGVSREEQENNGGYMSGLNLQPT